MGCGGCALLLFFAQRLLLLSVLLCCHGGWWWCGCFVSVALAAGVCCCTARIAREVGLHWFWCSLVLLAFDCAPFCVQRMHQNKVKTRKTNTPRRHTEAGREGGTDTDTDTDTDTRYTNTHTHTQPWHLSEHTDTHFTDPTHTSV